jgi:hypothetical protein
VPPQPRQADFVAQDVHDAVVAVVTVPVDVDQLQRLSSEGSGWYDHRRLVLVIVAVTATVLVLGGKRTGKQRVSVENNQ